MTNSEFNTFNIIINEDNEAMVLLYEREEKPSNPRFSIDSNDTITLYRNKDDEIELKEIDNETMLAIKRENKILVCELTIEENEDDTNIAYSYEATIA